MCQSFPWNTIFSINCLWCVISSKSKERTSSPRWSCYQCHKARIGQTVQGHNILKRNAIFEKLSVLKHVNEQYTVFYWVFREVTLMQSLLRLLISSSKTGIPMHTSLESLLTQKRIHSLMQCLQCKHCTIMWSVKRHVL